MLGKWKQPSELDANNPDIPPKYMRPNPLAKWKKSQPNIHKSYALCCYAHYEKWIKNNNAPKLVARGVKPTHNVLRNLPHANPRLLPKPDLLHTLLLEMPKHLIGWLIQFLKQHYHLYEFDTTWKNLPSYLDISVPTKTYEQAQQWARRDYHQMANWLLVCLYIALRQRIDSRGQIITKTKQKLYDNVLECTRYLLEFHMYRNYSQHDASTL
jgi:hypothetical protein